MEIKAKLHRLSFLKSQLIKGGPEEIKDIEPTICQILKDIFGIGNEFTIKASKIQGGFIVPSAVKRMYGQSSEEEYNKEKFNMYMKLISQAEAYISVEEYNDAFLGTTTEKVKYLNEHCVFLSYCWADTNVANTIDDYLRKEGINVARDIRDVDNWQSLKEFMHTIREKDFAVLLISDSYLKSVNCMYEVLEIIKEIKYRARIFPVVIYTVIYSTDKQVEYVQYWENKVRTLKQNLLTLEYTNGLALGNELKKTEDISRSIAEFLVNISDMKNPDIENINEAIYQKLKINM